MQIIKLKLILTLVFILSIGKATLNAQEYDWANAYGSSDDDQVLGIATDDNGNSYETGYFVDTVDFDPGSGVDSRTSQGNADAFVLRLNQTPPVSIVEQTSSQIILYPNPASSSRSNQI